MKKPKASKPRQTKPNIYLQTDAQSSPYVIDLRRAVVPPKHHPIELVAITIDPRADLIPHAHELTGQLSEQDFTPGGTSVPFEWTAPRLIVDSIAEALAETHEAHMHHAFDSLELPLDEDASTTIAIDTGNWQPILDTSDEPEDQPRVHVSFSRFSKLPHGWQKTIAAFVGLSFLFVLPIHAMQQVAEAKKHEQRIASVSNSALSALHLATAAINKSDFDSAADDFARAHANFQTAEDTIDDLSGAVDAVLRVVPQTSATYTSLTSLIGAGERLSKAAALFAAALSDVSSTTSDSPITKLDVLTVYLERMQPLLLEASDALATIHVDSLPKEHQAVIATVATELPHLVKSVDEFLSFNKIIRTMLGAEQPMRYLVLFQNNSEIRPTGGFIGSFAELTFEGGKIVSMDVPGGGSYDLQGSLQEFVAAPEPLQLIDPRWEFQDANWFPDFPTSAKKLLTFYDHAGGPSVDGVLAVNATFVARLIDVLGPVDMKSYGRTINSENFLLETQKIVEHESDPTTNKPKQFIADLAPTLLDRATSTDPEAFLTLLERLGDGFASRDAQLYLKDMSLNQTVEQLGWSGSVAKTDGDYLMVVDTNIGGGKTDLVVDQDVDVHVQILNDGSIVNTVTIKRTHTGQTGELFTGVNNVDYQRVYVPRGSVLLTATGDFAPPDPSLFESSDIAQSLDPDLEAVSGTPTIDATSGTVINQEFGKTVFGNWVQTKPGETSTVRFVYRLPFDLRELTKSKNLFDRLTGALGFKNTDHYSLFIQKQSGIETRKTTVHVSLPDSLHTLWSSDDMLLNSAGVTIDGFTDAYFASLFE